VAAGQLDRAEQLARTITNPYPQAVALTVVAAALAEHGTASAQSRSRRIIATLLTTTWWDEAMPVLAVVAPAAATSAAAALRDVL
jgi:hypothetical protein